MQEDRDPTELQSEVPAQAVVTEDPEAPVIAKGGEPEIADTVEQSEPGDQPDEGALNLEQQQQLVNEAAVTEDPDAPLGLEEPVSPVITEAAAGGNEQGLLENTGETEIPDTAQENETRDEAVEGGPNPEEQQQLVNEAAVTEDPDAPLGLEAPGNLVRAEASYARNEQSRLENTPDASAETSETAAVADNLTPEQGPEEEVSAEQLLIAEEQPKSDQSEAERLAVLEAIVYVTDEPLTLQQIAKALGEPETEVTPLLDRLVEEYNQPWHGLTVKEVAGGYKMATKPEYHEAVRTVVKNLNPPLKLSLAALETLAVIAYKQPITAPEIMEIRGVQGAGVLKTLIDRKLITTAGRKNVVGKPILYKTTREFLVQFGLRDLNELPTLKEFEDLRRMAFSDQDPEPEATAPDATAPEATPDDEGVQQPVE